MKQQLCYFEWMAFAPIKSLILSSSFFLLLPKLAKMLTYPPTPSPAKGPPTGQAQSTSAMYANPYIQHRPIPSYDYHMYPSHDNCIDIPHISNENNIRYDKQNEPSPNRDAFPASPQIHRQAPSRESNPVGCRDDEREATIGDDRTPMHLPMVYDEEPHKDIEEDICEDTWVFPDDSPPSRDALDSFRSGVEIDPDDHHRFRAQQDHQSRATARTSILSSPSFFPFTSPESFQSCLSGTFYDPIAGELKIAYV